MSIRPFALFALLLLLLPAHAYAQIEECGFFKGKIDQIVNNTAPAGSDPAVDLLDPGQGARCFAAFVTQRNRFVFAEFVRRFEGSRTDKQSGASANAVGSASAVSQGPVAKALSVAAEYGALTQSVNGQVVTLRGNLAGIPSALVQHNIFPYCVGDERNNQYCVKDSLLSLLRHVSFSASFDATRGEIEGTATPEEGAPVTFTADRNQLSAASAHIELLNQRDTSSQSFRDKWTDEVGKAMNAAATDLLTTAGDFFDSITTMKSYDDWRTRHLRAVRDAGRDRARVVGALNAALEDFVTLARAGIPDFDSKANAALSSYSRFFLAQNELIDTLARKSVLAVDLTINRPNGQPETFNTRIVADWPVSVRTKLVANAGFTWYKTLPDDAPVDMGKYRDAQLALQLDQALGDVSIIGPATFSAAVYYQYQHAPALIEVDPAESLLGLQFVGLPDTAKTVFAEKGNIALFQAKLTMTPEGSSMKIPIAVTVSNRTELIKKATWRAQVGLTYDFDSLFSLAGRLRPQRN
jgi:hypothetical protein